MVERRMGYFSCNIGCVWREEGKRKGGEGEGGVLACVGVGVW